ncbi:MAG TPA: outer membrane protein assembly factor BamA [Desulfosalsimonadaceae bacterium]|nr:outer membrane protein assembly factor BamA [Desulfosalsimonadaceae bacterium]
MTVKDVQIKGNQRIEDDAILRVVETRPGDAYDEKQLSRDIESIFAMGYFDDIRVETETEPDGKVVIFRVEEKPTIKLIEVSGNRVYEDQEIKDNIDITSGSILNIFRIKRNIKQIETLYQEKNYHNVKVTYKVEELDHNQANLEFQIDEGKKLRIREIRFEGNEAFDDKTLKKKMKTSKKGFFSWLTGSGDLDTETLNQDMMKLSDFYHNNGYAEARIGEPEIIYKDNWIYIEIKIDEGKRFKMGEVRLAGDLIQPAESLHEKLASPEEEYFNRQAIRQDVMTLSDVYSDDGYARADIVPEIQKQEEAQAIDIIFHIQKNEPVYFERIVIEGNTKTRDKVIRRELEVYEGEKYDGSGLKKSIRELYRLDYFQDVKVRRQQGSADDQMILNIQVEEKPTGTFSFGGGYSGVDGMYVMTSISERNLFGRGQHLDFRIQAGGSSQQYDISFTEPWLFDTQLSMTVEANKWERDYDEYDRDSRGGALRFGYPVFDYTRAYIQYAYDVSTIDNVTEAFKSVIAEGEFVESSVSTSLVYDSRNRRFNPTEGSKHRLTLEYAGIGGDIGFTKVTAETGWYFPLFWKTVGFLHGETGYVTRNAGKILPDYERFYLGGINSLRGFDWRDVSPLNDEGIAIGGEKYVQFNVEYLVPLLMEQGLVGLVFYDTGNAYAEGPIKLDEMRESWGYGIRWYSPMGPLRLERGHILDRKEDEDSSRWEFSIGGSF